MKIRYGMLAVAINLVMAGSPVYANDPFAELDQEVAQLNADDSDEFNQWYAEHIREFNAWQMAYLKDWDEKSQASVEQWGDAKTNSQDVIVIYDNEQSARTVIDLDKGEITINYKLPTNAEKEPEKELAVINSVIADNGELLKEIGLDKPLKAKEKDISVKPLEVDKAAIAQVKAEIQAQTDRQMSQLDIYAEQQPAVVPEAAKSEIIAQQKQLMEQNEMKRVAQFEASMQQSQAKFQRSSSRMVEYTAAIPSSAVSERAKNYIPFVYVESEKYQLPVPLVLAIMHTESHFNPKAKSYVPAYGLMQIVPTTAGHDVNKLYRGKDQPMKPTELYNPQINIETGTAYLKILQSRYLRGIKDPESAVYSVIAAYNTGSGNIAKAFGERSVSAAVKKINSMTPDQVYHHLMANLPYTETRNYLKKVNKRMQAYEQQQHYSMI